MPIVNLNPIKLHMHELITNPTGKKSAFGSSRVVIKDNLKKQFNTLIYKYKKFEYRIFKDGTSYFFYFKIPSTTWDKFFYDVVIEFYPDSKEAVSDKNINRYYLKVFSNSPNFMFTYTYVTYHNNMIPKQLIKFCAKEALRTAPRERNPVEVYGYEKSVYFACLYIMSHKMYEKKEIEKELYVLERDTWDREIVTQEKKLLEYNKFKEQKRKRKRAEYVKKVNKVNSMINERNKAKKKKTSSKKSKKK